MTGTVILWIGVSAYLTAWLFSARWLFGHWRARMKDGGSWYDDIDTGPIMLGALALALIWPLVPVFGALIRFMKSSPILSQAEMRARIGERDRRIAELEREAGIR
jgi:hypothetical protein